MCSVFVKHCASSPRDGSQPGKAAAIMPKRPIGPLVSGRVRLRLLEEADLPMTLAWRNQDHIRKWFFHSDIITPVQHRQWWEGYTDRDDDFVFVIEETETLKTAVGQVSLYRIDWDLRSAEFGRLLIGDTRATGQGLATAASARLLAEATQRWKLERIRLEVQCGNGAAIKIYRHCGFRADASTADGVCAMTLVSHPPPNPLDTPGRQ